MEAELVVVEAVVVVVTWRLNFCTIIVLNFIKMIVKLEMQQQHQQQQQHFILKSDILCANI